MENKMESNCLEATYESSLTFKTEYNLQEVHKYFVKWGILYVWVKEGDEPIEYEPEMECETDFKRPTETQIINEEDAGF